VTSSYQIVNNGDGQDEVLVTPDRVSLKCEDAQSDQGEYFGFSIFVLDNKDTVLSVIQTNTLDKESCQSRISKIGKILDDGRRIRIFGSGDLEKSRVLKKIRHEFAGKSYSENGRILQFLYILNENGGCYDAYSADEKPCPQNQ
jgi:hypothetical protein